MSAAADTADGAPAGASRGGGKKKLIVLLAAVMMLGGAGAGLWFSGIIPRLLGHESPAEAEAKAKAKEAAPEAPIFFEMPDLIANLNSGGRRQSFVKLQVRIEVAHEADRAVLTAAMPRLLDLIQTYLREMRPEELHGSAATYRLREELMARIAIAAPPAHVIDVLFTQMIVQ